MRQCSAPTFRCRRRAARCSSRAPRRSASCRPCRTNAQGVLPGAYFHEDADVSRANGSGGWRTFAARSIGNLARPFYPDGVNGRRNGPLSLPFANWSPFNTGLQLDLVLDGLVQHVLFVTDPEGDAVDIGASCVPRLGNGLQIFAGGVPIFRGQTVVGGIGVSGDGIDQDDMVAFLGLDRAAGRSTPGSVRRPSSGAPTASAPTAPTCAGSSVPSPRSTARKTRASARGNDGALPSPSPCPAPGPRRGHGGGRRGCPDSRARDPRADGAGAATARAVAAAARPAGAAGRSERGHGAAARGLPGRLHPGARPLAADGEFRRQRELSTTPTTRTR